MENSIDALKMAFAVIVFVLALSVSIMVFSQARAVSEQVFYLTDNTNFHEYVSDSKRPPEGRIVAGETIIPTLYRYYKENFNVIIKDKEDNILVEFNLEKETREHNEVDGHKKIPWVGSTNVDMKKRVDFEIDGTTGLINGQKYTGYGLLSYFKDKKFMETFSEYRYSGEEIVAEDGESFEYKQGNTKIEITYTEI